MRELSIFLILTFTALLSAPAYADDCLRTLIPETTTYNSKRLINYFNIRKLTRTQYEQQRESGGLSGEINSIPFSADYEGTSTFLSTLGDLTQIEFTQEDLLDVNRSTLTEINARIYMSCIQKNDILAVLGSEKSQNSVTISGIWSPQGQEIKEISFLIISGATTVEKPFRPLPNTPFTINFDRKKGQEFVVKVIAKLKGGEQISKTVRIPWVPEISISWAEIQRSTSDEGEQSDEGGKFFLRNDIYEGGATTRFFSLSAKPKFYIKADSVTVDTKREAGLNAAEVTFGPTSAKDLEITASKIDVRMHLYQPAHHGGAISTYIKWTEITPVVSVDGVVRAKLPTWVTNILPASQLDKLKDVSMIP